MSSTATDSEPIPGPSTQLLGSNNSRKRHSSDDAGEISTRNAKRLKPESSTKSLKDKKKRKKKKRKLSIVGEAENRPRSNTESSGSRTTRSMSVKPPSVAEKGSVEDDSIESSIDKTSDLSKEQVASNKESCTEPQEPPPVIVEQLNNELEVKSSLVQQHEKALSQVQHNITCQICLDLLYKPYALAPCGHTACHSCLVSWFTSQPARDGGAEAPRPRNFYMQKKTCPHCRAIVRERPVEVWAIKNMVQSLVQSGLLANVPQHPPPEAPTSNENENKDPWHKIFRPPPKFPANVYGEDRPLLDLPIEETGMYDGDDGGIYRCLDCMHEIEDGVCSGCDRIYDGHAQLEAQRADQDAFWDDFDGHRYMEDLMGFWANAGVDMEDSDLSDSESDGENGSVPHDNAGRYHALGRRLHNLPVYEVSSDEEDDYEHGSFIDDGSVIMLSDDDSEGRSRGSRVTPTEVIELSDGNGSGSDGDEEEHVLPPPRRRRLLVDNSDEEDQDRDEQEEEEEEDRSSSSDDDEGFSHRRHRRAVMSDASSDSADEDEDEDDAGDGSIPGPPARLRHLFIRYEDEDSDYY
ncbi:E3 ubiquitin ligase [Marasmius crinis-equi]|uniref:E3 ubiquitin ligase n=1 Tax=Marasmius crinis-equi TaxID=585013 RepID=A0ABR3F978_9AGAR